MNIKDYINNYPYINQDFYYQICEYYILDDFGVKYNPNFQIKDSLYIKTDYVKGFFNDRYLTKDFIIMTGHSDYPIDESYKYILDFNRLKLWFAVNVNYNHPKLLGVPLGIGDKRYPHGDIDVLNKAKETEITNKINNIYTNFSVCNNKTERLRCLNELNKTEITKKLQQFDYYIKLKQHNYVASPNGNGYDCHRTWESLYLGSHPVVINNIWIDSIKKWNEDCLNGIILVNQWQDYKLTKPYEFKAIYQDDLLDSIKERIITKL